MERAFPNRMNPTDALFWLLDKIPDLRSTIGALLILERVPAQAKTLQAFVFLAAGVAAGLLLS